jgi:hypothetical protein
MKKYSLSFGGPYYTVFRGKHMMLALKDMRAENNKLMVKYEKNGWTKDDNDTHMPFWRVVTGVSQTSSQKGCELLCVLE